MDAGERLGSRKGRYWPIADWLVMVGDGLFRPFNLSLSASSPEIR